MLYQSYQSHAVSNCRVLSFHIHKHKAETQRLVEITKRKKPRYCVPLVCYEMKHFNGWCLILRRIHVLEIDCGLLSCHPQMQLDLKPPQFNSGTQLQDALKRNKTGPLYILDTIHQKVARHNELRKKKKPLTFH